jgi:ribosomal protein S18 acetylase RimI-like enzyme
MPVDPIKPDTQSSMPHPPAPGELEPVTLRAATPADAPALALVAAATFLEAFTWMLPGPDIVAFCAARHTPEAYAVYLGHPDTRITLATVAGGAPVGYAMLATPELPSIPTHPTDIELKRIYLFSRFRSAPVTDQPHLRASQALLDAAIADANAMQRTRLLLGTHANNLRAIAFYRRNGFTEAGTRTFQVGNQLCKDLIFSRPL